MDTDFNKLYKVGLGFIVMGLGLGLPHVEFLDLAFSQFPNIILIFLQIGFIITGLGLVLEKGEA